MQLTKHTDYAFRVLIYLSGLKPQDKATIGQIAEAYNISKSHLMKIVNTLAANGYINATRGKSGGIQLAKPSSDIYLSEIVVLMEPTLKAVNCVESQCSITATCELQHVLAKASNAFVHSLKSVSLAEIVGRPVWQALNLIEL